MAAYQHELSDLGKTVLDYIRSRQWKPVLNVSDNQYGYQNSRRCGSRRDTCSGYRGNPTRDRSAWDSSTSHEAAFPEGANTSRSFSSTLNAHHDSLDSTWNAMSQRQQRPPVQSPLGAGGSSSHGVDTESVWGAPSTTTRIQPRVRTSTPGPQSIAEQILSASQQEVKRLTKKSQRQFQSVSNKPGYEPESQTVNENTVGDNSKDRETCSRVVHVEKSSGSEIRQQDSEETEEPMFCLLSPSLLIDSPQSGFTEPALLTRSVQPAGEDFDEISLTQTTITSEVARLVDVIPSPIITALVRESESTPISSMPGLSKIVAGVDENEDPLADRQATSDIEVKQAVEVRKISSDTVSVENIDNRGFQLMGPPLHPVDRKYKAKSIKKVKAKPQQPGKGVSRKNIRAPNEGTKPKVKHFNKCKRPGECRTNVDGGNINVTTIEEPPSMDIFAGITRPYPPLARTTSKHLASNSSTLYSDKKSEAKEPTEAPSKRRKFVTPLRIDSMNEGASVRGSITTPLLTVEAQQMIEAAGHPGTECVQMCLEFGDGGSSLRSAATRAAPRAGDPTVAAIVCAFTGGPLSGRQVRLPASSEGIGEAVAVLLSGARRRICHDARQLLLFALCECQLPASDAVRLWRVSDPRIASWLLKPDDPPATFSALLDWLGMTSARQPQLSRHEQLSADLRQLVEVDGRLMNRLRECGLEGVYQQLEVPLLPLLACMEARGLRVDTGQMHRAAADCQRRLRWLETAAHRAAGTVFQLSSHPQLRRVLYDQLQLDRTAHASVQLTGQGLKSTSEAALHQLSGVHPLPALVLEHRRAQKLKSTYVDGLLSHVRRGVIHPTWLQTAAATGRVQSAAPNVQSVPKQPVLLIEDRPDSSEHGDHKTILARAAFVARDQHTYLAADFQQMELRLLAQLSGDQQLTESILQAEGGDIFRQLSGQWNSTAPALVTHAQRESTKRIVYSVMYGVGTAKLAEFLHCSTDEARRLMDSFLTWCPAIAGFTRRTVADCVRAGFVTSLLGRRRWIDKITATDYQVRQQAERQAVNFRVQGSAADVCKLAAIAVSSAAPHVQLVAQLHDELLWEVPGDPTEFAELVQRTAGQLPELLATAGLSDQLRVPLPVSISTGTNWATMTKHG